ncbi:MAG: FISUMP domain-containing protein [Bacteroidota bacterium]
MKKTIKIAFKLIFISILLLTTTCEDPPIITSLKMGNVTTFAETTATVSAEFIDISSNVTGYGHCWATTNSPEVSDGKIINSGYPSKDEFSSSITGLSPGTEYFVRAFAMEGDNVIYGSGEKTFTTLAAKYINITAPVATDNWTKGSTQNITWTDNIDENVDILLMQGETIALNIADDTPNSGTYSWEIPISLANATNYSIIIRSVSDAGIKNESEVFEISEDLYISITAPISSSNWQKGSDQIITWTDNITENVNIELYKGGTKNSDIVLNTTNDDSEIWTIPTSLLAGDNYSIKISNVSDGSISDESADFTISAIIPTVITQDAISITENSATLKGTVNANGEEVTVSFEYGETTAYGNTVDAVPSTVSGTSVTSVSADISGLTVGTTYHFRLKAENSDGVTYGEDKVFATSTTKPTATTLAVSSVTETTAILNGTVNANGYETTVTFEYGTTDSYGSEINSTPDLVTGSTDTDVSASLTNLLAGTTYHYRVKAENSGGISYGDGMELTTNAYYINITAPISTDHWVANETYEITWNNNITENVIMKFYKDGVFQDDIVETPGVTGNSFSWTVPNNLVYAKDYTIRVMGVNDNTIADTSEVFIISEPTGTTGTVSDIEGTSYNTIKIGKQWWMAENLKSVFYTDGTVMTNGSSVGDITGNYTTKYYFNYGNSSANAETYGRLYTWTAAMKGQSGSDLNPSGVQGVCPNGWHLPSDAEWMELESVLGMQASELIQTGDRGTNNEGGQLKQVGTSLWTTPNTGANDSYQFTALPAGFFYFTGVYYELTEGTFYWSTSMDGTDVYARGLSYQNGQINRGIADRAFGFSVRCVRNYIK